jgi:hypothetical protein
MAEWSGRVEKRKVSLPAIPFYLAAMLVTGSSGLHGRRPPSDTFDIFSGGTVSVDSIVSPVTGAAEGATEALDEDELFDPHEPPPRDLPVWPPPAYTAPVDPAANPMINAPPQHVDWPAGLPSVQPKPAHSGAPPKD